MSGGWKTDPITKRAVDLLRRDSLLLRDGEFIGAEEELRARYGVSRPTLKLAAGIVAQDQLVQTRRGMNGGYFAARPTADAAARAASIFLSANGASLEELVNASTPIRIEIARLAALSDDPDLHAELEASLHEEAALMAEPFSYTAFLRADRRFWVTLSAACGNPVLQLFLDVLLSLVLAVVESKDPVGGDRARYKDMLSRRHRVAQAILKRDPAMAALAARCSTLISDFDKNRKLTDYTGDVGLKWS
ncbi:hypothetical protein GCM10007897_40770 [Sphingobium jiangsuense]|uniref:DNA-binding FadR family transcriptional regulator n=1 Tax=Sphingobium jiangsuense TaxID=870476 RepID=A0A7W6BU46_9SPHN|nr:MULTISPECIES: FCD domain-containing protein [Sphingobium]MBB3928853.1 DNA-binding FadR family transcriptional regulator [Sphingobium jiangsuense]WRD78502.1 FCD domain-containing protein [Sphingobium baderi]GLT02658.1 hypothetical protein GCM10007897_40770 [Sphingobium jiangsuense]